MGRFWIGKATERMKRKGTVGSFRRMAKRSHMSTKGLSRAILSGRMRVSANAKRKALFAANVGKARR